MLNINNLANSYIIRENLFTIETNDTATSGRYIVDILSGTLWFSPSNLFKQNPDNFCSLENSLCHYNTVLIDFERTTSNKICGWDELYSDFGFVLNRDDIPF